MTAAREEGPGAHGRAALDRRDFLRRLGAGSVLAAGSAAAAFALRYGGLELEPAPSRGDAGVPERKGEGGRGEGSGAPPVVAVVKGDDPAAAARKALELLGGMKRFVRPGEKVLVKPNIGWDRRPKFAANTNPEVVAAVVRAAFEAGASRVWVTDSPCNNPVRCFDRSGLRRSLEGSGAELFVPSRGDYVEQDLRGAWLGRWPVLRVVLEADKIVNVPIAKHHSSAVLTLGMKNWYGILGGGKRRGRLHQRMAESIVELAAFVRPVLTVLDAYRILFRNGPQGGSLLDTKLLKTVVASTDPVAVDAFAASFFGLEPRQVPFIPLAAERGLGVQERDRMKKLEAAV